MAKETITSPDSSVPLAEIAATLGLLVVVGQKLLARVDAIAKLSGVEVPDEAPAAAEAVPAEPVDQHAEDLKYAFTVATNHLGEQATVALQKLNDEGVAQLVAAGRSGDLAGVKQLLGISG